MIECACYYNYRTRIENVSYLFIIKKLILREKRTQKEVILNAKLLLGMKELSNFFTYYSDKTFLNVLNYNNCFHYKC